MEPKEVSLISPQSKPVEIEKKHFEANLSNVFDDRNLYLNTLKLFATYFNAIPNFITEINIDCKKAHLWFKVGTPVKLTT